MQKKLFTLILFVIFSSSVLAIALTPPDKVVIFDENGKVDSCGFNVKPDKDTILSFRVEGDLKDNINFTTNEINVKRNLWYPVQCIINLPKDLKPGPHEVQIITVEGASPGGVGAVAGIIFPVRVFVPYPGKYLEIQKYHLDDIAVNETAVFTVNVISRGDQKINDVKLVVNLIYNERTISTVQSKSIKLEKNQNAELTAKWDSTGTPPGIYNAEAVVYYDEKQAKESKELKLGQLRIDILNIKHDKIFSDSIAKFDLELKSVWNSIISDAYIILDISDKDNNPVKQLRGENFAIGPWDRAKQSVYWDTKGVKPGKYKGK